MKTWTASYAHCVKATPGQLDREPWFRYELRPIQLHGQELKGAWNEFEKCFEVMTTDGGIRAVEDTLHDAVQSVLYQLMDRSRKAAIAKIGGAQ